MKFIQEEISGQGRTRYMFALGKTEAQILLGLLDKALQVMPRLSATKGIEHRIRNMSSEIRNSIPNMPVGQDNGEF